VDNRSKRRREKGRLFQDFSGFALQYHEQTARKISPQLALAAFQFLSSSIDLFKTELISNNVLRRLMQQSQIIRFIRVNKEKSEFHPAETLIFQQVNYWQKYFIRFFIYFLNFNLYSFIQGKPADYFVLILEGRVEVTVGKENLVFESGPFSHYGSQALTSYSSAMGQ
jgi:metal transporter CNNM